MYVLSRCMCEALYGLADKFTANTVPSLWFGFVSISMNCPLSLTGLLPSAIPVSIGSLLNAYLPKQ